MKNISLFQRANQFNRQNPNIIPLTVHNHKGKEFLVGYWFLGGSKQSSFYGSYSNEYLARITTLFSDGTSVVHLFSGSLPPGPYTRVGIDPTGAYKPDIEGDAQQLSSFLPFKPDLIYADPPYTHKEAEQEYQISLCNGPKVISECAAVLQPGGFLVWLDTVFPVFNNNEIRHIGSIQYIRSTGNRFRCISIFQKSI